MLDTYYLCFMWIK